MSEREASSYYYDSSTYLYYDDNGGGWYLYFHQTQQYVPCVYQNANKILVTISEAPKAENSTTRKVVCSLPDIVQAAASAALAASLPSSPCLYKDHQKHTEDHLKLMSDSSKLAADHSKLMSARKECLSYGNGYGEPKYDTQAPMLQQPYAGQAYAPQQKYNRQPSYALWHAITGTPPQCYAAPAASQTAADTPYQAPVSAAQPYHTTPQQQQYPQAPYCSVPVANVGYNQPQPAVADLQVTLSRRATTRACYAQTAGSTSGYGQYPPTTKYYSILVKMLI
ncbi:hypothetical protein SOVF_123300 [Spinacia oleracea]|nr:hypothetical protein SOVF_123300 [Spinacia oleracea]